MHSDNECRTYLQRTSPCRQRHPSPISARRQHLAPPRIRARERALPLLDQCGGRRELPNAEARQVVVEQIVQHGLVATVGQFASDRGKVGFTAVRGERRDLQDEVPAAVERGVDGPVGVRRHHDVQVVRPR